MFCGEKEKGGIEIMKKKKSAVKKLLPWVLLAAFSALVFYYDENGRIIED